MPRFYFDVQDGSSLPDQEGTELPDTDAARDEAVRLAGGLLNDRPDQFWRGEEWRIDVRDEAGAILFSLAVVAEGAEAVRGKGTAH